MSSLIAPPPNDDDAPRVDMEVFRRVEQQFMLMHAARFEGPPDETDPASLMDHILFWQSLRPNQDVADCNAEDMARSVLVYGAQLRLSQRVKALPERDRDWLNRELAKHLK